jgi:hypothetical protein
MLLIKANGTSNTTSNTKSISTLHVNYPKSYKGKAFGKQIFELLQR